MQLLIDLFFCVCNTIGFILTNKWAWVVTFSIIGIATLSESKGAGVFCIFLALIVLIG